MRILVLQLARFGDIYQTWPALNALKRQYPGAELHVLVRQRFRDALNGFEGIVAHSWPTADILEPIYLGGDENESLRRLQAVLAGLEEMKFDRLVNLSFSPASSYIADIVAHDGTEVTGYTRHPDGFLKIPDDASAYFFAQGEIGRFNRFHIAEIFGLVAQVELQTADFQAFPEPPERKNRIVVHLGASQSLRVYPAEKWVEFLKAAVPATDAEWILVGSADERAMAETVCSQVGLPQVINQAGQTRLPELMQQLAQARLFVGCDSAPAQMASLTQTPVLQLTSETANFWTTGPTSAGSRVIYETELQNISASRLCNETLAMLKGEAPAGPCAVRTGPLQPYILHDLQFDDFSWHLIEALYTQAAYPRTDREEDLLAFQRLFELAELALLQIENWNIPERRKTSALILKNIDQMLLEVSRMNKNVDPLIQWFETERLRMPPASAAEVLENTRRLFSDLLTITSVYRRYSDEAGGENRRAIELCRKCAPAIREFKMASVHEDFQRLISTLQEISRHSTKVGDQSWSALLGGLNEALDRRDLIEVADQLEYVLIPALS